MAGCWAKARGYESHGLAGGMLFRVMSRMATPYGVCAGVMNCPASNPGFYFSHLFFLLCAVTGSLKFLFMTNSRHQKYIDIQQLTNDYSESLKKVRRKRNKYCNLRVV